MMLRGIGFLSSRMQFSKLRNWSGNSFYTKSCLLEKSNISDVPLKLKKLKLKQAAMQKPDGVPVYLKKGLPDKILYNLTLGLLFVGMIWVYNVLCGLDHPDEK